MPVSAWNEVSKGLWKENPLFRLALGLCPALAVTTSLELAVGMGLAVTFVVMGSNLILSLFRRHIPATVRIPVFIVVISSFVTLVRLVMAAEFPALKESMGIFLPLIAVNCVIFARAEAFASRNGPWRSVLDGLGTGLGFTLALASIGGVREILGEGRVWGWPLAPGVEAYTQAAMLAAPGGFLLFGLALALLSHFSRDSRRGNAP